MTITTRIIKGTELEVGDHFLDYSDGHYYEVTYKEVNEYDTRLLIRDIQQRQFYVNESTIIQKVIRK